MITQEQIDAEMDELMAEAWVDPMEMDIDEFLEECD